MGDLGAVYRATDTVLERPVALKVLAATRGDRDHVRRLTEESLHAAKLSHPHVVTVYDAGEVDGTSFVAMRWVEGRTLEAVVDEDGPLPPQRVAALVEQLAGALEHAHGCAIVHRDVTPANVMVGEDGSAYLMDFGLGERLDGGDADTRVDVHGLGALAFTCLTGHAPGPAPAFAELPDGLDVPLRHALAEDPDDRPLTPGELARELRVAVGPAPAAAVAMSAPAPPPSRRPRPTRGRPRPSTPCSHRAGAPAGCSPARPRRRCSPSPARSPRR